ncbi:MAG TPA: VOC family protein [Gemmataceae bacterium]|nr:VOC family protein [Gemmataceae bacterium]
MAPIETIVETGVYADDLAAAETFYRDVLGLEVIGREAGRHVFFRVGASSVLLVFNPAAALQGSGPTPHGARGPGHFAFGVRNGLEAWKERLAAHGVAIEKEVNWPRGAGSIYFRDPAGNSVEIMTPGLWGLVDGW